MPPSPEAGGDLEIAQNQKDGETTQQQTGIRHDIQLREEKQTLANAQPVGPQRSNYANLSSRLAKNAALVLMGLVIAMAYFKGLEKEHNENLKATFWRNCNNSSVWH